MNDDDIEVLVTGGSGFIGRWLLAALTRRGRRVAAVVRDAERRAPELSDFIARLGGDASRLRVLSGDIEAPGLGLSPELSAVRDVFHLAARFEFGLTPREAQRANVDGTGNVLAWAAQRASLRRFVLLGGYRMTRPPALLAGARYPLEPGLRAALYTKYGAYEASKYESHLLARAFCEERGLALTTVHPSSVIGDSRSGLTTQRTGLAETFEKLYLGQLPAKVGTSQTFVPVVAVDYLAAFLASVADDDATAGQELTVLDDETPPLSSLLDSAADHMGVRAPRAQVPVGLVRALPRALTKVDPETLHFLSEDRYDTDEAHTHARAASLEMPDTSRTLARWYDELLSTRFGREPGAARGAMREGLFVVGDPATCDALFLHGLPWNADLWRACADQLGRKSARVDLPGLGRSHAAPAQGERWLSRLLEGRTTPTLVVGHSLGASVALRFALEHPQRVSRLVLVSPAFLQARASLPLRVPAIVGCALSRSTPESLARRTVPQLEGEVPEALRSAVYDLRRPGVARRVAQALAGASSERDREALRAGLARVQVPVTIVHGASDPLVHAPARGAHPLDVIEIEGAGHVPQLTHAREVAAIVRRAITTSGSLVSPDSQGVRA